MIPPRAICERRDREWERARTPQEADALMAKWAAEDDARAAETDWRTKEVAELRRRVAALERTLQPGGVVADAIASVIGKMVGEQAARIDKLDAERLKFCGTHEVGAKYAKGSLVVRGGSLWCAIAAETCAIPGKDPSAWQLCVKSAQKGGEVTIA